VGRVMDEREMITQNDPTSVSPAGASTHRSMNKRASWRTRPNRPAAVNGSRDVRRDESGAVLILALIFLLVVGMVVGSLASWATNDLNNTAKFTSARTVQYSVSGATENAIQNMRYTPLFSTQLNTTAASPSYCWGTSAPSAVTIDNLNVAVWCSTVWTPTSAATRVVTFSACPVTSSETAASCAAAPTLQAVVTFGDYPPGYSAPYGGECQVYCGTSMTINDWIWSGATVSTTTTTTTTPPTTTTTTTTPPTTTTTTTTPPSNGVTVSTSTQNYNYYGGQDLLNFTNSSSVTALSITIHVAQTTGISYASQFNSFPGGALTPGDTTSGGYITYTFVLNTGQTIPANYSGGQVGTQWTGTGSVRVTSGDLWSVTSTSGGTTSTLTGTF
jgi:hypothetical protein